MAISNSFLSIINASLDFIGRIVLVQSFGLTFRALTFLWITWAYVDDIYLVLIILTCTVFLVPRFYHNHTKSCDSLIELFEENSLTGIVTSHFSPPDDESEFSDASERSDGVVSQSKDILSACIIGVLVVLAVKYIGSDQEGQLPNLFIYLRSVYWPLPESN